MTWTISTDFYSYDALNRVSSVSENHEGTGQPETQQFLQSYIYDRYGNRTINQGSTWGTGINNKEFTVNTANNRLGVPVGQNGTMTYDNAGNLTTDTYSGAAVTRVYDAENRMTSETQANNFVVGAYTYNADGQRVRRKIDGIEAWQVYGMDGELLAEYPVNGAVASPQKEYGYRNGQLLITATVSAGGWGPPPGYTPPDPLVSGWEIKLEHLTELRSAVNQLRTHAGLSAFNFTVDPNPERNVTTVKAEHIRQLRTALEGARSQLGLSTGGYAHSTLTENSSWIYAIDFQELRAQILSAWNSGTGGVDIRWLVTDHLGTPRIIIDKTGSLANVKRHDYLPFGEELVAGQGGRTAQQGYVADGVRQKLTSKERDIETGLDFFGARYYASTQGRFTSSDPLLSSGSVYAPQTWNRYSYTINNPLKYTDPFGMYICNGTKDQCKDVEKGLKNLEKARDSFKKGSNEYNRLDRSRNAYGAVGVDNGVTVAFGTNKTGSPAATVIGIRDNNGDGMKDITGANPTGQNTVVTIDTSQHSGAADYAGSLGHEGSHVADGADVVGALPVNLTDPAAAAVLAGALNLTKYQTEIRAYGVSAGVAQGLGYDSLKIGPKGGNQYEVWNSGWKQADRATKQAAGIDKVLAEPKSKKGLYEVTPTNQGKRLIE